METVIETDRLFVPVTKGRQPLCGLTVLLVEDSRYCAETMRLLCRQSGARLRRADCREAAYRHLATYRPSLVIVDIGLPDGSGLDIVRDLAALRPNGPVVLATSGDDPAICRFEAFRAGATGFLEKPLRNIASFQAQILKVLPDKHPEQLAKVVQIRAEVRPDSLAVSDDLRHAISLLRRATTAKDVAGITYCIQFLRSVAHSAGDKKVARIAGHLARAVAGNSYEPDRLAEVEADLSKLVVKGPQM